MLRYGIAYQGRRGRRMTPRWQRSLRQTNRPEEQETSHLRGGLRDEKVGRVVSFVMTMSRRHQMSLGIVCMMKSEVVPVEDAANPMMTEAVMEQGLAARYGQMGTDGSQNQQRKLR